MKIYLSVSILAATISLLTGCSSSNMPLCKWPNPPARVVSDTGAGTGPWFVNLTGFSSQTGCCDNGKLVLMFRASLNANHAVAGVHVTDAAGDTVFESDPEQPHIEEVTTYGQGYLFSLPFEFDTHNIDKLPCGWTITLNLGHSDGVVRPDGRINIESDCRVIIRCSTIECGPGTPPPGGKGWGGGSLAEFLTQQAWNAALARADDFLADSDLIQEIFLDAEDEQDFADFHGFEL